MKTIKANVHCELLMVSGFDVPEVVAAMDVSSNFGNSIKQIEQFVLSNFPNDPKYMKNKKFAFPLGHQLRIVQFVRSIQSRAKAGKPETDQRKCKAPSGTKSTSLSSSSREDDDQDEVPNIGIITADMQRKIVKWVRNQNEQQKLQALKENYI